MSANVRTAIAVLILLAVGVSALAIARVPGKAALASATGRAALQLAVVGALVTGVLRAPLATALFLAVMLTVACGTTVRRLQALHPKVLHVALACVAGAAATVPVVLATGALPASTRYVLALSGITLGGTMTACTLAGRRLHDSLLRRRDEVEGWLALGATSRQAVVDLVRRSVFEGLVPALDQTRTVGLVTLPGAFVGALAGGATAGSAARFQLLVLVSLLAAESIAACVLTYLLGAPDTLPETEQERSAPARAGWWTWPRKREPAP
ncbi:MAG TPA: ABC transporter permease [Frankiaceae bacterium]|nr:ABC transporter permease [Frankiaceae bacterium]